MSSVNKATIVGNLGRDPETRHSRDGTAIISFSVATSQSWKDRQTGDRREATEWHNIVIFNEGIGKVATSYLRKGSKVYLEGEIKTRKWQDQNGQDRYSTEIILPKFGGALVLLDGRQADDGQRPTGDGSLGGYQPTGRTGNRRAEATTPIDDEIPF